MNASTESINPRSLGPDYPEWIETLRDKTRILIRPIAKDDAGRERDFIEALSPQARRFRFLGQVAHPSDAVIARFTDIDYGHEIAFAAVAVDAGNGKFLGVSRYSVNDDGTGCECAVTVLDDWHHKGLGTLLMKHLIEVARARGILHMYSIDSIENTDMRDLAKFLGFTRRANRDDPTQVIHSLLLQT